MKRRVYLAGPYSHEREAVRDARAVAHAAIAGRLMADGDAVFSPIAHGHFVTQYGELDAMDQEFWMEQVLPWLEVSQALYVLKLDGWEQSKGVAREMIFARENGIPITYLDC